MRWHDKDGAVHPVEFLVQGAPVTTVSDSRLSELIHEIRYHPGIVRNCTAEGIGTKPSIVVDTGMQFKAVVFALPVVSRVSVASGDTVVLPAHKLTDLQHG